MTRNRAGAVLAGILLLGGLSAAQARVDGAARGSEPSPRNEREDVSKIGDRNVGKGVNFYSLEKEMALGKQLASEVERNAKIVDDPVIAEYVNRLGQNLARNSDSKVPFTIKVIDSEEVNAFALPGGFFYVNTGLIGLAESEAELAGVMAHEIAHVAARHGTRSATRAQLVQFASIPLLFVGGWAGYGISQAANFAIPMTMLKFSRDFERQADFLGVQYLYNSGYDPTAMVEFFERLHAMRKRDKGAIAKAFSSHPMTGSRIKAVQATIDRILPRRHEYKVSSSEFDAVKERVARIHGRTRTKQEDPDRPTLRRTGSDESIAPVEVEGETQGDEDAVPPKLRRRSEALLSAGASETSGRARAEASGA